MDIDDFFDKKDKKAKKEKKPKKAGDEATLADLGIAGFGGGVNPEGDNANTTGTVKKKKKLDDAAKPVWIGTNVAIGQKEREEGDEIVQDPVVTADEGKPKAYKAPSRVQKPADSRPSLNDAPTLDEVAGMQDKKAKEQQERHQAGMERAKREASGSEQDTPATSTTSRNDGMFPKTSTSDMPAESVATPTSQPSSHTQSPTSANTTKKWVPSGKRAELPKTAHQDPAPSPSPNASPATPSPNEGPGTYRPPSKMAGTGTSGSVYRPGALGKGTLPQTPQSSPSPTASPTTANAASAYKPGAFKAASPQTPQSSPPATTSSAAATMPSTAPDEAKPGIWKPRNKG